MDKEIIELLKAAAASGENLLLWYMVLDVAKVVIGWIGAASVAYLFGKGAGGVCRWIANGS